MSEANRIFNRTNPPIVAKIKDYKIVRMRNLHNFRTIDSVFFPTRVCDTSCQSLTHAYRALIRSGSSQRGSRRVVPQTTLPIKKTLAQFMTYEQLFICRLSNLPRLNVSIVLTKLAIVNMSSRKQEWTFVHSVVLHLIHQKFN